MKSNLISMLVQVLMVALTPDWLKQFADMALDFVEEKVAGSASTVDDAIVLPLCNAIRAAFNIPDNDEPVV